MIIEKYNNEDIQIGDLISLKDNKAIRSIFVWNKKPDKNMIGVCTNIHNDEIEVATQGIADINVIGSIAIGDEIGASEIPGKGRSIKYIQEKDMFNIRSIGKVIYLYKDLSKARIMLNVE